MYAHGGVPYDNDCNKPVLNLVIRYRTSFFGQYLPLTLGSMDIKVPFSCKTSRSSITSLMSYNDDYNLNL